jgi:hypothetical protein
MNRHKQRSTYLCHSAAFEEFHLWTCAIFGQQYRVSLHWMSEKLLRYCAATSLVPGKLVISFHSWSVHKMMKFWNWRKQHPYSEGSWCMRSKCSIRWSIQFHREGSRHAASWQYELPHLLQLCTCIEASLLSYGSHFIITLKAVLLTKMLCLFSPLSLGNSGIQ